MKLLAMLAVLSSTAVGCAVDQPSAISIHAWLLAHNDYNCIEYDDNSSHFLQPKFNGVPPGFHVIDLARCYGG